MKFWGVNLHDVASFMKQRTEFIQFSCPGRGDKGTRKIQPRSVPGLWAGGWGGAESLLQTDEERRARWVGQAMNGRRVRSQSLARVLMWPSPHEVLCGHTDRSWTAKAETGRPTRRLLKSLKRE